MKPSILVRVILVFIPALICVCCNQTILDSLIIGFLYSIFIGVWAIVDKVSV